MLSMYIHVVANSSVSIFFMAELYIIYVYMCECVHIYHIFFIYSSIDGYLGFFHILAIVNYVARNMRMKIISSKIVFSSSLNIYPEVELLDHMAALFLIFWGNSILFSIIAAPIYIPINSAHGFLFLHILTNACYCLSFWWWPFWKVWGGISL